MMIDSKRDYSEEIADICERYHVKYLGLHGSVLSQEDAAPEDQEINLLVEFLPLEPNQHTTCFFALEKELKDLFGRHVNLCDLTDITHPDLLRQLTKRKTDIYKV
ncbi:nucleotidyltransferase family protein [Planctomycetota bacterium]